jgi:hypothetical protein
MTTDDRDALTPSESREWQDAAVYFARRGVLPPLLSARVAAEIHDHPDPWEECIRTARYADSSRDMLAALSDLLDYAQDIAADRRESPSCIARARAALGKAHGTFNPNRWGLTP